MKVSTCRPLSRVKLKVFLRGGGAVGRVKKLWPSSATCVKVSREVTCRPLFMQFSSQNALNGMVRNAPEKRDNLLMGAIAAPGPF